MKRNYLILPFSEISTINFEEVMETSSDTLRYSVDSSKTFIKWVGATPSFYDSVLAPEGPYTHTEILTILKTSEWTNPDLLGE